MGALQNAQVQGGTPIAPQLADAAAQAGAPAPAAGAPQPAAAPAAGPAGPPAAAPAGPPGGSMPQNPVEQVDPGAAAVDGHLPPGVEEEQASPEEQAEYERAMRALSQVLYGNDKTANAIVDQIIPEDKIQSTTMTSLLVFQQLDEKLQMDESVVPQMTQEITERIMELAEARHEITYGDREVQVIMGSVWEGIQQMFGMDQQDAEGLMAGLGGEGVADLKTQHEAFLNG